MDSKLQWRAHIEDIRRKVTKTIGGLASLGNSAWGIGLQGRRKIYEGAAVPQMMYACSAWSHARSTGVPYTQNTLHTLENLQARAARAISGAFKATSYAALNVEAHLMPVSQRIEQRNKEALIQMLSAGRTTQDRTRGNRQTRHFNPLQSYAASAERQGLVDDGFRLEIIPAFAMPPWQQGPVTHIEPAAEARSTHDRLFRSDHSTCIYTDGSRINGHIGAAAVLPVRQKTMKAYVGPESASTVYAAELQGINLALQIAVVEVKEGNRTCGIEIFTDNQAAIRSLSRAEGKSGACILKDILVMFQELQQAGRSVTVRWIPSHTGIIGNEAADAAAKEAARDGAGSSGGNPEDPPDKPYALKPALRAQVHRRAEAQWTIDWQAETKGKASRRYTPTPSKKVLRLHSGLSKKESSILVQMRTEKIGLREFLFNRKVPGIRDRNCSCRGGRQTVQHLLLTCRNFKDLRQDIFGQLPERTNLRTILSERKLAIKAIKSMEQTQILGRRGIDAVEQTQPCAGGRL